MIWVYLRWCLTLCVESDEEPLRSKRHSLGATVQLEPCSVQAVFIPLLVTDDFRLSTCPYFWIWMKVFTFFLQSGRWSMAGEGRLRPVRQINEMDLGEHRKQ